MQWQVTQTTPAQLDAFRRRHSNTLEDRHHCFGSGALKLLQSLNPLEAAKHHHDLEESLQKLFELEEENTKLKEDLRAMGETAEKALREKEFLAEKLQEKVDRIKEFQQQMEQQNQNRNIEWVHRIEHYHLQMEEKKKELEYQREEFEDEISKKEKIIEDLSEQYEQEKQRVDQLFNSDFSLNQKLNRLETENDELQKELIESQVFLLELKKEVNSVRMKDVEEREEPVDIGGRVKTLETETDTTYAIQTMEEKIIHLRESNRAQKEKYKASMKCLVEYYEDQLYQIKAELVEEPDIRPPPAIKHKVFSIRQNAQNQSDDNTDIPLKDQLIEISESKGVSGIRKRKKSEQDTESQFSERYFHFEPLFRREIVEEVVEEMPHEHEQSNTAYSTNRVAKADPDECSVKSMKSGFSISNWVLLVASGALAVYTFRKIMQSR